MVHIGINDVLAYYSLKPGRMVHTTSEKRNRCRVRNMKRKSSNEGKKRRKTIRSTKKGFLDEEKEKEQKESYVPGGF